MLEPIDVVTIWLALDESNKENGAMKVIPATHHPKTQDSEYEPVDPQLNVFSSEIKRYQFDESTAVTFELLPNQASLHHSGLMHGSEPNKSCAPPLWLHDALHEHAVTSAPGEGGRLAPPLPGAWQRSRWQSVWRSEQDLFGAAPVPAEERSKGSLIPK